MLRRTQTLLVCQILAMTLLVAISTCCNAGHAGFCAFREDNLIPNLRHLGPEDGTRKIFKCRPLPERRSFVEASEYQSEYAPPGRVTPKWELASEFFFARAKGKVRFVKGNTAGFSAFDDVDLNSDLGLPDHSVISSFVISFRFKPTWALRYSVMPTVMRGTGQAGKSLVFGNTFFTAGQETRIEWERFVQRIGLVYTPVRSQSLRIGLFGDYVRATNSIKVTSMQTGLGGDTMKGDLNMAMAGIEFEQLLRQTSTQATLSLECTAGVAFGDDAVGGDFRTALKYVIPLNNGRSCSVKGGYRYLTSKRKMNDLRMFDMALEGGFLQMGIAF